MTRSTDRRRADVVVVGGGISGQASAAALAARGADVVVVEKEAQPAFEGSGRAQGSLRLQGRVAAELPLAEESVELWKQVEDPARIELSFDGNIYLCDDPSERPMLEHLQRTARAAGLDRVELMAPEQARKVLPAARGEFDLAMWSPYDGRCDPAKATRYFADLAASRGVEQRYGLSVRALSEDDGRIAGVVTERGPIEAKAVVLAAGVWTTHLARTAGVRIPIMPVVVSQCETTPVAVALDPTIRAFACGCRQRPDGRVVLSAGLNTVVEHRLSLADASFARLWLSRLRTNHRGVRMRPDLRSSVRQLRRGNPFDTRLIAVAEEPPAPNRPAMERALTALHALLPETADSRLERVWSGMIDLSPDGLPIIDGGAGPRGLVVVTGLSGHGLALGPVTGQIAADLALEGRTGRPVHPFRLARFSEESTPSPEKMI
jgi:glycine/D-amino acid oxidase-like deaminating enzyme